MPFTRLHLFYNEGKISGFDQDAGFDPGFPVFMQE